MIVGEIRVGDRLRHDRTNPDLFEVIDFNYENEVCVQYPNGQKAWLSRGWISARCDRADPGWTPITPDTLPGEDVKQVFLLYSSGTILNANVAAIRSVGDLHWGSSRATHWRPVPLDWLPLPTKDTP